MAYQKEIAVNKVALYNINVYETRPRHQVSLGDIIGRQRFATSPRVGQAYPGRISWRNNCLESTIPYVDEYLDILWEIFQRSRLIRLYSNRTKTEDDYIVINRCADGYRLLVSCGRLEFFLDDHCCNIMDFSKRFKALRYFGKLNNKEGAE